MHEWDPDVPLEETLRTLEDLVRAGKVRYVGSNVTAEQLVRALGTSACHCRRLSVAHRSRFLLQCGL